MPKLLFFDLHMCHFVSSFYLCLFYFNAFAFHFSIDFRPLSLFYHTCSQWHNQRADLEVMPSSFFPDVSPLDMLQNKALALISGILYRFNYSNWLSIFFIDQLALFYRYPINKNWSF